MKKKITVFFLLIICVCVVSCGKKEEAPEFADALFVKLSYTPVDINSDELTYTINIEIYQDSTMRIYADDFIKWYGDEEPETINISISNEDLENVKKSIIENDLYSMQRDVGNKDNMAGVKKSLIIYTKDGEYSVYGINPSNKRFNYVFDMITDLNREELVDYIDSIDLIQKNGAKNDVGIYITDEDDNIIFKKKI
ncbi:MAG: hypothetical protein IJ167_06300 [Lachnospiraceae bacterium]|nr:hypothetical protein [Lachnospiraceae bacterium]